jgi:hypothetical protein
MKARSEITSLAEVAVAVIPVAPLSANSRDVSPRIHDLPPGRPGEMPTAVNDEVTMQGMQAHSPNNVDGISALISAKVVGFVRCHFPLTRRAALPGIRAGRAMA